MLGNEGNHERLYISRGTPHTDTGANIVPLSAAKPCRRYGCRKYQTANGYCDEHQELARRIDTRDPAHKRGYDSNWSKFRAVYLRQHPTCIKCEKQASTVHHIKPLDEGGAKYDEINLVR